MEFSTIILIALPVMFIEFLEYTSGMDPNLPPDVMLRDWWAESSRMNDSLEVHSGATSSSYTNRSQLDILEEELKSLRSDIQEVKDKKKEKKIKKSAIRTAKRRIEQLENEAEEKKKEICQIKIRKGITLNPEEREMSSLYTGTLYLNRLKDDLEKIQIAIQQLTNKMMGNTLMGGAARKAIKDMKSLQEKEMEKKKEIIEEELRMQLNRPVETEEVEQAYIEQKKRQRILELQQRKTEIEMQLEKYSPDNVPKVQKRRRLIEELENIEKELNG